ncbi:MAG: DNA repair protein RecO [Candidatus Komeilibacteria bacterium]|nr:DNA repair protein RecO [Candidatus Komeilibacteria bacterium]
MSTFNTEAIVLAKLPLFEADRQYILYTPGYGKLEARVKSAALSSSKLAGSLEPISLALVMIARGKTRETVAGAQLIKRFNFDNLAHFGQLGLIRELFLKLVPREVPEAALYNNLSAYLNALEKCSETHLARFLTVRFIWQMLRILGYGLDFPGYFKQPLDKNFSSSGQALFKSCFNSGRSSSAVSGSALAEVENFTKAQLLGFLERDLFSYKFLPSTV